MNYVPLLYTVNQARFKKNSTKIFTFNTVPVTKQSHVNSGSSVAEKNRTVSLIENPWVSVKNQPRLSVLGQRCHRSRKQYSVVLSTQHDSRDLPRDVDLQLGGGRGG